MHFEMMNIEMIQMAFHFVEVNMKKKISVLLAKMLSTKRQSTIFLQSFGLNIHLYFTKTHFKLLGIHVDTMKRLGLSKKWYQN